MAEEGPPLGRREAAEPAAPAATPPDLTRPVPPTMVLGYLDLAITGALEYPRFAGVYLGPWWEVPEVPEGMQVWKRSVLKRIPARGAEHWGHLYLVVRDEERRGFSLFGRSWRGERASEAPPARLSLRAGDQSAEIALRPSTPEHADQLNEFAEEISERFRRQMD